MITKESRKTALKEDIEHIIEELWRIRERELLCKIVTGEFLKTKDIQKVVLFSKTCLHDISCRDKDDIEKHETGDVRVMFHCQRSLIAKNLFPKDMDTYKFTSITRKDYVSFSSHPDAMALLITTCDVTSVPPPKSVLDEKFKAF